MFKLTNSLNMMYRPLIAVISFEVFMAVIVQIVCGLLVVTSYGVVSGYQCLGGSRYLSL
jgi:hypothetical protein